MKYNKMIPELTVMDIEKTKNFYIEVLNFTLEYERVENRFIFLSFGEAQFMFEEYHKNGWNSAELAYPLGRGINFSIEVDDIDLLYENLLREGIRLFRNMKTEAYLVGDHEEFQKEFLVQDPDGYLLRFTQMQ